MNQREKFVSRNWNSARSLSSEEIYSGKKRRTFNSVTQTIQRVFEWGFEMLKNIFCHRSVEGLSTVETKSRKKILDPQGPFLQKWNKIFVLSCVMAVSVDPLFFYVPVVNRDNSCLELDHYLEITASVLRFFTDLFYMLHIIFQFRTGFIAPSSRVLGRGILVEDPSAIARRYLSSYFIIDILAVLPLPQVVILITILIRKESATVDAKNLLMFIVIFQYVPRLVRIIPLYLEVTRSAGIITETAWAGAAFNLLLYMLASHVLGAFWYLLSIEREFACWRHACHDKSCAKASWYCAEGTRADKDFLANACPIQNEDKEAFDFGMYLNALNSNIVQSRDFIQKLFYCFWWGLQNLSSLGQNLQTSTYVLEILFAVFISLSGLVLFSLLIGNMQTYLQSTTVRIEEMRVKRRDAEQWMSHRQLPETLKERIRRHEQYRWQVTRGVDEENLIRNLPQDLRRDIKRHLCLKLLMRVPMFEKMDYQLMDAMCVRLRPVYKPILYIKESIIVREGDPVDEMLFIIGGKLLSVTTNGGCTGFNSDYLKGSDFCGEELLTWALDPSSYSSLPISTRTVKALTEVEAFALMADDLKYVASQFRRLHSKQLRHTFRFHSQQWRIWAACFIQTAWCRYTEKKFEEALWEKEIKLQGGASSPNLGGQISLAATIYASRFAVNALKAVRRNGTRLRERLSVMLLQKPSEPDFTSKELYVC